MTLATMSSSGANSKGRQQNDKLPKGTGKRIINACQRCKSRKIRCDGATPICGKCSSQNVECVYGERRWRGKGRTQTHVKELQQRLEQMEHSLRSSGITHDNSQTPVEPSVEMDDEIYTGHYGQESTEPSLPPAETSSSIETSNGEKFVPLPEFLSHNMAEIKAAGNMALKETGKTPKQFVEMMPKENAIVLVYSYLEQTNAVEFPLFHRAALWYRVQHQFAQSPEGHDPAWWATFNTILATTLQLKAINNPRDFDSVSRYAWGFFKNAWSVYGEIIAGEPSLLSVLALLIMARFLEGSTDLRTMSMVMSAAVRMVTALGMHREPAYDVREDERDQRRRVFWCTYLLDKRTSIDIGLPPLLDHIYAVKLPNELSNTGAGCIELADGGHANIFRLRVQLSILENRLQKLVLSPKPTINEIQQLSNDLENWRSRIPPAVQPESDMVVAEGVDRFPLLMLHLAYYHLSSEAFRAIARCSEQIDRDGYRVAAHLSASASRLSLSLVRWIEPCIPFLNLW
ncbi:hypothetical protein BU24DRAFT_187833 [Aaosphaeria arxii CBS 175.79]|uniref:Zn(2)-C6 fungal-type domain-containing protein n=1 Tax=Aaosphaeria arxii CBS 175.79 TaxID=1450172 RepID=A0A6A5XSM8_9PLEO|nr:uncharacterized protein BU24DRAFT_187833 [Aaosphaeria arxii CBS 175.79]KAF2015916.1 hypothetical protein BU24DRAFT_187833 [Aaosphaeria arxii CBS 175.79]